MKALGDVKPGAVALHDPLVPTRPSGDRSNAIATTDFVRRYFKGLQPPVVGDTPPVGPCPGQFWWDTVDGQLYIWTGRQWVTASCCEKGGGGADVVVGASPPDSPDSGQLWFDTVNSQLNVWNGSVWMPAVPPIEVFTQLNSGLVPAPGSAPVNAALQADGTWRVPGTTVRMPTPGTSYTILPTDDVIWMIGYLPSTFNLTLPAFTLTPQGKVIRLILYNIQSVGYVAINAAPGDGLSIYSSPEFWGPAGQVTSSMLINGPLSTEIMLINMPSWGWQVYNRGVQFVYRDDVSTTRYMPGLWPSSPTTVASLPVAGPTIRGVRATVTDALNQTGSVQGGGTNVIPVFCDGVRWRTDVPGATFTATPAAGFQGEILYNTGSARLQAWNSADWQNITNRIFGWPARSGTPQAITGDLWWDNETFQLRTAYNGSWWFLAQNVPTRLVSQLPDPATAPPGPASWIGARSTVTDALNQTGIARGGGANTIPVFCDGINWISDYGIPAGDVHGSIQFANILTPGFGFTEASPLLTWVGNELRITGGFRERSPNTLTGIQFSSTDAGSHTQQYFSPAMIFQWSYSPILMQLTCRDSSLVTTPGVFRVYRESGVGGWMARAVASLPTPTSALQGCVAMVQDALSRTYDDIVAGGGANIVPVWCDGTNWRIG